jgi:hypothetical protein
MSKEYKPVPRVRMTLSLAIQNRCLHELCAAFGIGESHGQIHEITCFPGDFAYFMGLVAKMDKPPTLKQLRVEYVDIRNDVKRTTVQTQNRKWNCEEPEPEGDLAAEVAVTSAMHMIKVFPIATALWWFIENVSDDHPNRNELFFALRVRVRENQGATD